MLRLTIPSGIEDPVPVQGGRSLKPGKSYLCSNRFVGQMLLSQWRSKIAGRSYPIRTLLKVDSWSGIQPQFLRTSDWNNRDLWLSRGGGWGDLLALTPVIREINDRWPDCRLHVAMGDQYFGLFYGLNVIEEMLPIPFDALIMMVDFEELVEGHPDGQTTHIIDLFAKKAGIELTVPEIHYKWQPAELASAFKMFPKNDKTRIAVQFLASALYRSYPQMQLVIKELAKENEIFIFGFPGQVEFKPYPNVTNLMEHHFSFRQSAAILGTCDICIAPDSSLVHLCAALNIPCLALYGPIPSSLRISGDSVIAMDGKAPCAPCFFHANKSIDFPPDMPCTPISRCVALESISVGSICDVVYSMKSKLNGSKAH